MGYDEILGSKMLAQYEKLYMILKSRQNFYLYIQVVSVPLVRYF